MNYADQVNSFLSDYNEVKNDFESAAQSQVAKGEQEYSQAGIEFGAVQAKKVVGEDAIKFGKNVYNALKGTTNDAASDGAVQMSTFSTDAAGDVTTVAPVVDDVVTEGTAGALATAFGVDSALDVVPVIGAIATVITAIVSLFSGHHEIKNVNSDFSMPQSNVDLPTYHPGIN